MISRKERNAIVFSLFFLKEKFYSIRSSLKLCKTFYLTHFPWRRREHRYKSKRQPPVARNTGKRYRNWNPCYATFLKTYHRPKLRFRSGGNGNLLFAVSFFLSSFLFFQLLPYIATDGMIRRKGFCQRRKQRLVLSEISFLGRVGSRITICPLSI